MEPELDEELLTEAYELGVEYSPENEEHRTLENYSSFADDGAHINNIFEGKLARMAEDEDGNRDDMLHDALQHMFSAGWLQNDKEDAMASI